MWHLDSANQKINVLRNFTYRGKSPFEQLKMACGIVMHFIDTHPVRFSSTVQPTQGDNWVIKKSEDQPFWTQMTEKTLEILNVKTEDFKIA